MAPPKKTLYQILGVSRDANKLDIGMAHDRRVDEMDRTVHPDPSQAALVQQAWEILADPKRRSAYDAQLLTAAERKAAAEQAAPDLEIGGEEDEGPKGRIPVIAIAVAAVVGVVALFFVMRSPETPKAPAEPVAQATKPAPPAPPPKPRTAAEVLAEVSAAAGPFLSYSMSGASVPLGMALAIEPGTMVTTCHGIPAGSTLVVRVGKEQHPADLTITDETLDLCRLSVATFGKAPLRIATDEPKAGDKIFAVTTNAKGELAAAEGTVKALRKVPAGNVIEVSMPIPSTSSGGGVLDQYGKLIGVATTPHAFGPGHFALPSAWIVKMRSRAMPSK